MSRQYSSHRRFPFHWLMLCAVPLSQTFAAQGTAPDLPGEKSCAALAGLSAPGYQVDTAEWVPASRQPAGPPGVTVQVPAHCLFRLTIGARESGIEGMRYGTGIELRLPADWNQRLLFQGGGGLNGVLNPAFGNVSGFPSALTRGFAVVSTDSGHRGRNAIDTRFGVDQQRSSTSPTGRWAHDREPRLLQPSYGRKPGIPISWAARPVDARP
jgi:feruloyl esterase